MKPKTWFQSANLAIDGIIYSVKTQRHMRYHLYAALAALVLSLVLNISRLEFILLCMAIVIVLATETMNTAIETTVDMISAEFHPKAKLAKDIAAGVVLIASVGALMLAYLILYPALRNTIAGRQWRLAKAPHDVIAFVSLAVVIILVIILLALGWVFGKFDRTLSSLSPKITSSWIIHHQPPPGQVAAPPQTQPAAEPEK